MIQEATLRKIADALIEGSVLNYYNGKKMSFILMLNGVQKYNLEAFPGAGHNYRILLEQIYEYSKANPNVPMKDILYNSLLRNIQLIVDWNDLNLFTNYVLEQLDNEKSNKSPFALDNQSLLNEINSISLIRDKIKNAPNFQEWRNNINRYLQQEFSMRLF